MTSIEQLLSKLPPFDPKWEWKIQQRWLIALTKITGCIHLTNHDESFQEPLVKCSTEEKDSE